MLFHISVCAQNNSKSDRLTDKAERAIEESKAYKHHCRHPYFLAVSEHRIRRRRKYQQSIDSIKHIYIIRKIRYQLRYYSKSRLIAHIENLKSGRFFYISENIDIRIIVVSETVPQHADKIHCAECNNNIAQLLAEARFALNKRIRQDKHQRHKNKIYRHKASFLNKKTPHTA